MDGQHASIFITQIRDQCGFAINGGRLIDECVRSGYENPHALWAGCQMVAVGVGNVSKALWGGGRSRPTIAPTRQPLRRLLEVEDSSPLYDFAIRNDLEHFDERIDRWWAKSKTHSYADRNIGTPDFVRLAAEDNLGMFRGYDPATGILYFWGHAYPLVPVIAECERVGNAADALEQLHPDDLGARMAGSSQ